MSEIIAIPRPEVGESPFKAIIWASAAVALPFVPFRIYVRWRVFHKLFIDDALVIFAYLQLLAFAIVWQEYSDDLYMIFDVAAGLETPKADFLVRLRRFLAAEALATLLYGFGLWSIKLAFLLFFKRLGRNVVHHNIIWWSVLTWNVIALAIWLGVTEWRCIATSAVESLANCDNQRVARFSQVALKLQTSMDVISDASIMLLPFILLWKVQIRLHKKLALGGIFSLTIFIMIASVIRVVVVVVSSVKMPDLSWLYTWSALEMAVAVIVACLASFRALFTSQTVSERLPNIQEEQRNDPERQALRGFGFKPSRNPFASISLADFERDSPATFDSSLGKTTTYVPAKNASQLPEHDDVNGDQEDALLTRGSEARSVTPRDNYVHVRSEVLVYPEAARTAERGSLVRRE